jgi:hypothetical protein
VLPGWLYPLSLVALAVLMVVEPAFESRGWATLLGILTPTLMFVSMQLVIERGTARRCDGGFVSHPHRLHDRLHGLPPGVTGSRLPDR